MVRAEEGEVEDCDSSALSGDSTSNKLSVWTAHGQVDEQGSSQPDQPRNHRTDVQDVSLPSLTSLDSVMMRAINSKNHEKAMYAPAESLRRGPRTRISGNCRVYQARVTCCSASASKHRTFSYYLGLSLLGEFDPSRCWSLDLQIC